MYARMSKNGRITIPKAIREKLKIDTGGGVLFLVEGDTVKLEGIPGGQAEQLAGSLKQYAKEYVPLNKIRKKIKGEINEDNDQKWASEAKERLEELRSGKVKPIPGDEVFKKIWKRFEK